jgi:hypothetical protein
MSASSSSSASCTFADAMVPAGINDTDEAVVLTVPAACGSEETVR